VSVSVWCVRELEICRGHAFIYGADEGLVGLAAIDATEGRLERAARLFGTGDALGYFSCASDTPVFDRLERDYFGPARERYGAAAWRQAAQRGAAMPYDQAIAYALDDCSVRAVARSSTAPTGRPPRTICRRRAPAPRATQLSTPTTSGT
jgi:hypothetical protein